MIPSWANDDDSNLPAFFHVRGADGSAGYTGSKPTPAQHQPQQQQQQQQPDNKKKGKDQAHARRLWGNAFGSQVQMDSISAFSVTPCEIADEMSSIVLHRLPGITTRSVITDATACVGGNTVSFAKIGFQHIQAFELDEERCRMCFHNVEVFRRAKQFTDNRIEIYQGDCLQLMTELKQDVVFLDPPWGGKDYKSKSKVLLFLSGKSLPEIVRHASQYAQYVALKLPVNAELDFVRDFDVLVQVILHGKLLFLVVKRKQPAVADSKRIADLLGKLVLQPQFHHMLEARIERSEDVN